MADYNLGTARGKIQVDYDGKGVAAAGRDVRKLTKSSEDSAASMRRTGLALGAGAAVAAAGLVFAAKTAINFEKQISAIAAVSGATGEQIDTLRKKALQLGRDTAFSASQAANAMEELAKAGISLPDILNGAADATVALAAAGGIELPFAAEIAANAMNSFALSARDMPKIADIIAGAANASAIDVNDFGLALKQSGAVANLVGLSFKDLAVAIALMGQAGIKGSDAGTSLKTMLSNLQPQTKKQIDLFKQLGLITRDGSNAFFDAQGNVKGLGDIAGILQDKLKNMTAQQKQATLELIFGSDAIRAAAVLTQAGAKGFEAMANAMGKVSAADVAKKRLDNVAGAIEQLKGSAETLAIEIGTAMLPAIKSVATVLTGFANALSGVDPKIQKTVVSIIAGTAAVLGLVAAVALLRAGVVALDIAALFNPVTLAILAIIAGLALVAFGIKKAWDNSKEFRDTIRDIRNAIVQEIIPSIQQFADMVGAQLKPRWDEFVKFIRDNAEPAFARIHGVVNEKIIPALKELDAWWAKNKETLLPLLGVAADFALMAAKILAVIVALSAVVGFENLAFAINAITFELQIMSAQFAVAKAVVIGIGGFIGGLSDRLSHLGATAAIVGAAFVNGFNWVSTVVSAVMAAIGARVNAGVMFIIGVFNGIGAIVGRVQGFFNGIKVAAATGINSVVSLVSSLPGRITGALGSLAGLLFGVGRDIVQGFINGITAMIGRVAGAARAVADAIPGPIKKVLGLASPSKVTRAFGQDTARGLALGVLDKVSLVQRASEEAARAVAAALANIPVDSSVAVSAALSGTAGAGLGRSGGSAPEAPPGDPRGPAISQTFNVPAAMNAKEVATYSARRLNLVLSGADNTGGSA